MLTLLCGIALAASLVLGGGTRSGFPGDVALQLLSLPLLAMALARLGQSKVAREVTLPLCIALAAVAVPLMQLVPLPPEIWTALPGRAASVEGLDLAGIKPGWMPLSVAPHATWLGLLSLVPPFAIFLATVQLGYAQRRELVAVMIAIGVASVFVGLLQIAQGESSPLRLFEYTNLTEPVGFFANRNHFAAMLYCLLAFMAAWLMATAGSFDQQRDSGAILSVLITSALIVVVIGTLALTRSRSGLALGAAAIVGGALIVLASGAPGTAPSRRRLHILAAVVGLGLLLALEYALRGLVERFTIDPLADGRLAFARNTYEAARTSFPYGTGVGSFVWVYGGFEKPADVTNSLANRAHNDFLELALEGGLAAMLLCALTVAWLLARLLAVLRDGVRGGSAIDNTLAKAAVVSAALLLTHSALDYPLRTAALVAVFALCCGLAVPAPEAAARAASRAQRHPRVRTAGGPQPATAAVSAVRPAARPPADLPPFPWPATSKTAPTATAASPSAAPQPHGAPPPPRPPHDAPPASAPQGAPPGSGTWGDDMVWPEAWRKK